MQLCPECGSGKIEETGLLVEGLHDASCQNCGWKGKTDALVVADLDFPTQELVLRVAQNYMVAISHQAAQPIGLAMVQSGLVGTKDAKTLARLVRAACLGAHRATLDEITTMQKERTGGDN